MFCLKRGRRTVCVWKCVGVCVRGTWQKEAASNSFRFMWLAYSTHRIVYVCVCLCVCVCVCVCVWRVLPLTIFSLFFHFFVCRVSGKYTNIYTHIQTTYSRHLPSFPQLNLFLSCARTHTHTRISLSLSIQWRAWLFLSVSIAVRLWVFCAEEEKESVCACVSACKRVRAPPRNNKKKNLSLSLSHSPFPFLVESVGWRSPHQKDCKTLFSKDVILIIADRKI